MGFSFVRTKYAWLRSLDRSRVIIHVISLLALCGPMTSRASASGIPGIQFGYELGTVVAANPTAIAYNPGGLAFSGTQLMLELTLAMRSLSWTHAQGQGDAPEPAGFAGANYGTAKSFLIGGGPQAGASLQIGKLVLGGGWYVPYGGGSFEFDRNESFANSMYPGAADGVARWHGYKVSARYIYGTGGAAVRLGPFGIGATGNLILASYEVNRAQNSPLVGNDLTREQRVQVETSGLYASFALGVMFEALPERLWFGASYQAQPALGEMVMTGKYTIDPTPYVDGPVATNEVALHQSLPDIIRFGARWKPSPTIELRLTGSFTRWGLLRTMCIGLRDRPCTVKADGSSAPDSGVIKNLIRNWNDTISVHAGGSLWVLPDLELFAGVRYENAAMPDATIDPLLNDADNLLVSLGGRLRVAETWFMAASYNHLQYFPRDNTGRSQLADPAIQSITRGLDGGGQYRQWFGAASLNLVKTF